MDRIVDKYTTHQSENWNGITSANRYRKLYTLVNDKGDVYTETPDKIVIPNSPEDTYYQVGNDDENRLDLISFKFYNTPLLWWVIALSSDISNPLIVPAGTVLRIPPKSTLYGYRGILL